MVFAPRPGAAGQRPAGRTAYLDADLRDPEKILAEAADTAGLRQPVAVMLMAVLQFVPDRGGSRRDRGRLLDALRAGQLLVLAHPASDIDAGPHGHHGGPAQPADAGAGHAAHQAEVRPFLRRARLVPPGVVRVPSGGRNRDATRRPVPAALGPASARK